MPNDYQQRGRRMVTPQGAQAAAGGRRHAAQQPYQQQQRPQAGRRYAAPQQPVIDAAGGMRPAAPQQGRQMSSREDELRDISDALSSGENGGYTQAFKPITDEQNQHYQRERRARQKASVATITEEQSGVPVVEFQDVTKIYPSQPNRPALENVSFSIYPGEFVFLIGHSGSGKSTTLNMIIAQQDARPTSGKVCIAGQNLGEINDKRLPYLRRQIGCVFQDFKLLDDKTVYQNVAFVLECLGHSQERIKQQVPEVLKLVGLADQMNSYPNQLSGGEQQRVSIARAMVNRPPLLICDEPTGNLDPAISEGIMQLLERINKTGTTVICSTHDQATVEKRRRRVIALKDGHLVYDQQNSGYVQPSVIASDVQR